MKKQTYEKDEVELRKLIKTCNKSKEIEKIIDFLKDWKRELDDKKYAIDEETPICERLMESAEQKQRKLNGDAIKCYQFDKKIFKIPEGIVTKSNEWIKSHETNFPSKHHNYIFNVGVCFPTGRYVQIKCTECCSPDGDDSEYCSQGRAPYYIFLLN